MNKSLHPLAIELNTTLAKESPELFSFFSDLGKRLFFPKGIITQSNEAKQHAKLYDATIGIATEQREAMSLPSVRKYLHADMSASELFPYAPSRGVSELRQFWKDKIIKENPTIGTSTFSLPVVTSGISHGLSVAGELFLGEDDPILMPDQFWGNYRFLWVSKLGAQFVEFPTFDDDLKGFNFKAFEERLDRFVGKKQSIVFNFPNNPTGYSPTIKEVERIRDTLVRYADKGSRFVVFCDDAYFGMVWEDSVVYESLFAYLAGAHRNILALKFDGCTKEGFMWGFRVGFLTCGMKGVSAAAYEALETKIAGSIRASISSCSHPSQTIVLKAFKSPNFAKELEAKKKILQVRYQEIKKHVHDKKYSDVWDVYPCQSGYFLCLRLKKVEAEPLRKHLLMTYGVGTVSSGLHDLRIAYSCLEKESIADMVSLTAKAVRDLQGKGA